MTLSGEDFGYGSRRLTLNRSGLTKAEWYDGGWETIPSSVSGKVLCDSAVGYIAEIAIPRAELDIRDGRLLFNAVFCKASGMQSGISGSQTTEDWVYIKGLK